VETSRDQLSDRLNDTVDDLHAAQIKVASLTSELSHAREEAAQLQVQVERVSRECSTLKNVAEQSKAEAESVRAALYARPAPAPEKPAEDAEAVKRVKRDIKVARGEIAQLSASEVHLKQQLEQEQRRLKSVQEEKDRAESECTALRSELSDCRARFDLRQPTTIEVAPTEAFTGTEFDGELALAIQKVAGNPSFAPAAKIRGAFRVIANYYNPKIDYLTQSLQQLESDHHVLYTTANQCVIDLLIAFNRDPVPFQTLIRDHRVDEVVRLAKQIAQDSDDMRHTREILKSISAGEPPATIDEVKQFLLAQANRLGKKSRSLKAFKTENAGLKARLSTIGQEYGAKLDEVTIQLDEAIAKLEAETQATESLRNENRQILKDLNVGNTERSELQAEVEQLRADQSYVKLVETANALETTQQELANLQHEYNTLSRQSKEEGDQLKSAVHALRVQVNTAESEVSDLQLRLETTIRAAKEKLEKEKALIADSYDTQLSQLSEQYIKQGDDLQRVAALLAESEEAGKLLKTENDATAKRLARLSSNLRNVKANAAKEKKLLELKAATERLAFESEYYAKLDEVKAKTDSERRRAYSFGADVFKSFFNPLQEIDERSFKSVLLEAKLELDRLTASDSAIRRLIGATGNQSTQDAVARIVVDGL
jgi:chromosome segregation ATPase